MKKTVLLLTRIRLNPNAQFGSEGLTLLHAAAINGEVKLVSAIGHCKFDANNVVDFKDSNRNTALHHAVIKNKTQVKQSLWTKYGIILLKLKDSCSVYTIDVGALDHSVI